MISNKPAFFFVLSVLIAVGSCQTRWPSMNLGERLKLDFNQGKFKINHSSPFQTHLPSINLGERLKLDFNHGKLNINHDSGHGGSAGLTYVPGAGAKLDLTGTANVYTSPSRNTRVDIIGNHNRGLSGQSSGQSDWGAKVGLTLNF